MANSRSRSVLSRVVNLQPGEGGIAVLLFLYFFFITSPYYIIKSLRNASFLDRLTDERLPLAYFLTAVLMGLIVNLHSRLQVRLPRRSLIVGSLGFFLATMVLFGWLLRSPWEWVPVAFWVWANIFAIVLVTQFWILVNDTFNPREAKRLIGFIGSGAQLGAILGGLLAGVLARLRGGVLLLPFAAAMLALGIVSVLGVFQRQKARSLDQPQSKAANRPGEDPGAAKFGFRDAYRTIRGNTFLKLLAGIMVVTWVVSTLIDYQFNSVVSGKITGTTNLASFFGFFNAGTMTVAFLIQLLLTSRIIKAWGIRLTLLIYPAVMLLFSGGLGIVAYASLVPAMLLKASDKSLAYSLNQSVRELLYIPISPEQKYRSKLFIDMFLNRFAKGLGAVILMVFLVAFPRETALRSVSLAVAAGIAVWIGLNLSVGREYGRLVKDKLDLIWERGESLVDRKLDVDAARLVFDTLASRDRSEVLYSMNLFDLILKDKLTPELRKLIGERPGEIRAASLGTVFEETGTGPGPAFDSGWDDEVLKKEVREIMELDAYQEVMKAHIGRALRREGPEGEVERMEAARAIGFMSPLSPAVDHLGDLIRDGSVEVSRLAIASAAAIRRRRDVPALVEALRRPGLREDAAQALEKYGPGLAGTMADYLHDPAETPDVRRAAAAVLARFGTQEAAEFLIWGLGPDAGPLDEEIVDALDMIRAEDGAIVFPGEILRSRILNEGRAGCRRLVETPEIIGPDAAVAATSGRREEGRLRLIFQLLGLIYPHEDIAKAYQNFKTGTKNSVAYAIELLDTLIDKDLRDALFPLLEDLPEEERRRLCRLQAERCRPAKKES